MLTARSERALRSSRISSLLVIERRFRLHVVRRERLVFDTRFSVPGVGGSVATIFVALEGRCEVAGQPAPMPAAYVASEREFERVAADAVTIRTEGDPAMVMDLMVRAEDLRVPVGLSHGPLSLPSSVWSAIRTTAAAALSQESPGAPTLALVQALVTANVLHGRALDDAVDVEPPSLRRLWDVLTPLYATQAVSASVLQVKKMTGLSLRQLIRDVQLLTKTFGLPGEGFREITKVLRLRSAVVLLSAPDATATEVAAAVGYRSLEAMGRAFRDAKLPAPSVIQQAVRYSTGVQEPQRQM